MNIIVAADKNWAIGENGKVAHVTKIDHAYQADTFFPNLDETGEWEITADSDEQTYFDLEYAFLKYERKGEARPRIRK